MSDFEVLKQDIFAWVDFKLDIDNTSGLSDTEVSNMEKVVVDERRRLVVDAIAGRAVAISQELDRRQVELESDKYITNLVLESLKIRQPGVNLSESTPQEKKRIKQFDRARNCNGNLLEFLKIIGDEPGFSLSVPVVERDGYSGRTGYDLREWSYERRETIKRRYGSGNYSSFTRAARKISLNIDRLSQEMPDLCRKVPQQPDSEQGIRCDVYTITNTSAFIQRMLKVDNFGHKSAVALLAIADMQAEEQAAQELA